VTTTVIRTLALRESVARRAASGLLLATDVADYLVRRGIPFRAAHEITGRIVRDLDAAGRDFSSLSLADWRRYSEEFNDDVAEAITPSAAVEAKRTPQSTHPAAVAAALAETRTWLARMRA
jgi:argininosuccinate lyase